MRLPTEAEIDKWVATAAYHYKLDRKEEARAHAADVIRRTRLAEAEAEIARGWVPMPCVRTHDRRVAA